MVEKTLNSLLKKASTALNLTTDNLGGIGFSYFVDKNEYLADDNTEYTGGDIAAAWEELTFLLARGGFVLCTLHSLKIVIGILINWGPM